MNKKITNKIIAYYALLVASLVAILLFFFLDLIRDTHLGLIRKDISEKIRLFELMMKENPSLITPENPAGLRTAAKDFTDITDLRITILSIGGDVLADSKIGLSELDNHLYRKEVNDAIRSGEGESIRYSNTLRTDMLYVARRTNNMVLRLARPLHEIDVTEKRTRIAVLFFGLIAVGFAMIIVYLISRRITRPIQETMNFAKSFSEGDYSRRVLKYDDDEIGALQRSLNKLADIIVEKIDGLELEQKKLMVTIDNINDGIAVIDAGKRIILANRALASLVNMGAGGVGRFYYEIIRSSTLNERIEHSLLKKETCLIEEELLSGKTCEVYIIPLREDMTLQGVLLIMHDITERKKIDRLKTELVGNLSHELKTPIAIIKGYLETMIEHIADQEKCRDFIGKALVNVDRQNSIIDDMLKLNMLETTTHFPTEIIDLNDVIESCLNILNPKIAEKNIEVKRTLDIRDTQVTGSRFLAEEIFFNIIDNAINYNVAGGSIILKAEKSGNVLSISITDTGIGIPDGSIDRIFERFYRVDKSRSRATGGTGLGLSIVKHAVEILDWSIAVASSPGGTTFTMRMPYRAV